jgi:hypothetical protein
MFKEWGWFGKARSHGIQGGGSQLKEAQACYERALAKVPSGGEAEAFIRYFYALWAGVASEKYGGGRQKQIELLERAIECVGPGSEYGIGYGALLEKVKAKAKEESKSGGCFIATAACGSEYAWEVMVLRAYRDQVLSASSLGRAFIAAYYRVSPPIARVVARVPSLRRLIRDNFINPVAGKCSSRIRRDKKMGA